MQLNHFHDTALPDRIANETKSLPIHLGNSMPAESKFPTFPENAACRVANRLGERDRWVGGWVTCIVIGEELNCKWPSRRNSQSRAAHRALCCIRGCIRHVSAIERTDRHKSPCIPKRYTPWQLLSKQFEVGNNGNARSSGSHAAM